jgi:hypothetical protein
VEEKIQWNQLKVRIWDAAVLAPAMTRDTPGFSTETFANCVMQFAKPSSVPGEILRKTAGPT